MTLEESKEVIPMMEAMITQISDGKHLQLSEKRTDICRCFSFSKNQNTVSKIGYPHGL